MQGNKSKGVYKKIVNQSSWNGCVSRDFCYPSYIFLLSSKILQWPHITFVISKHIGHNSLKRMLYIPQFSFNNLPWIYFYYLI